MSPSDNSYSDEKHTIFVSSFLAISLSLGNSFLESFPILVRFFEKGRKLMPRPRYTAGFACLKTFMRFGDVLVREKTYIDVHLGGCWCTASTLRYSFLSFSLLNLFLCFFHLLQCIYLFDSSVLEAFETFHCTLL